MKFVELYCPPQFSLPPLYSRNVPSESQFQLLPTVHNVSGWHLLFKRYPEVPNRKLGLLGNLVFGNRTPFIPPCLQFHMLYSTETRLFCLQFSTGQNCLEALVGWALDFLHFNGNKEQEDRRQMKRYRK